MSARIVGYIDSLRRLRCVSCVSVTDDGERHAILLGPYETHDEARDNVFRARQLAGEIDRRSAWYAFGTCSAPVGAVGAGRFGR